MKLHIKIGLLLALGFSSQIASAVHWPRFSLPDKTFLITNHFIQTDDCPVGFGKITNKLTINVRDLLCTSYCPPDWQWTVHSNNQCESLEKGFELGEVRIMHLYNDDGTTDRSVISADYSNGMTLTMETHTNDGWYCGKDEYEENTLTCANDQ